MSKSEWAMFIDADERVTPQLREEINDFIIEEKEKPVFNGMY